MLFYNGMHDYRRLPFAASCFAGDPGRKVFSVDGNRYLSRSFNCRAEAIETIGLVGPDEGLQA
jgi:hypothetical protein